MILHTHRIPARAEQRRLLVAFMDAAQKDETAALEELFAADIVSYSDGASRAHLPQWRSRIPRDHNRHNTRHRPDHVDNEAEQAHSCYTFVATLTGAKGPHHSRLISPYLSLCSAVSQIGRLSGHSKYKTESAPWRLGRRTGGNYAEEENNTGVSAISHLRHAD